MYTDDGIVLRFADVEELPAASALIPDPEEVEELITDLITCPTAIRSHQCAAAGNESAGERE